jgi:hypothetical protein
MEFLKKNYEKILLGLVLAGLIGTLIFMLFYIAADQQAMDSHTAGVINPHVTPLPDLNLTTESNVTLRLKSPYELDFDKTNKLFNSMKWEKTPDGTLIKISSGNEIGANAVIVTNIQPLYLILTLDSVTTNELGARYVIGVEKQAEKSVSKRRKQQRYVSMNDKNDTFALVQVKGAPENPDALVVKLADTGDSATIPRGQSYKRADAYEADFRYDPEKKVFREKRIGDRISFGGTDYVVVEVNQNELILSDQSNERKYSLPFVP